VTLRGALVFDASSGRPKLSLRQAFNTLQTVERWAIDAVFEFTVNRLYALDARVPPTPGQPGAPTESELEQLGRDLFSIDRTALVGAFRRERIQLERDRALADEDGEDADFEADEESALEQWTADREREFREAAVDLWEATRREQAADRAALSAQLAAIRLIQAATEDGSDQSAVLARALSDGVSAEAIAYLEPWAADPTDSAWVRHFRRPGLKLPKIRDFLSPNRSAIAKGYLQLLRDVHSESTKRERQTGVYGSIYGSRWPERPTATTTPPDHVRGATNLNPPSHTQPTYGPAPHVHRCSLKIGTIAEARQLSSVGTQDSCQIQWHCAFSPKIQARETRHSATFKSMPKHARKASTTARYHNRKRHEWPRLVPPCSPSTP
jgi:hypothetical protein